MAVPEKQIIYVSVIRNNLEVPMRSQNTERGKKTTSQQDFSVTSSLLTELRRIGEMEQCRAFLSKAYGLELLLIVATAHDANEDNGIDDTYENIRFNKPRPEAFRTFVRYLVDRNCLTSTTSPSKRSKKILRLPDSIKSHLSLSQH